MTRPDPDPSNPLAGWRLALGQLLRLEASDGRCWTFDGLNALLVARLALAGAQARETLARQMWPEADPARARGNLRQRLLRLKLPAGPEWIVGQTSLALAPDLVVWRHGDQPLLPDLPEPMDESLALWLESARRQWQAGHLAQVQARLTAAEAAPQPDLDLALALATDMASLQPEAEAPRRELARLHYLRHDCARALQELDALAAMLRRVHASDPSAATLALRALVVQARVPDTLAAPSTAPLAVAFQRPPQLIGRARELAFLRCALLPPQVCLLLGEAGLGKSRLLAAALDGLPGQLQVKARVGDAAVPHATLLRLMRALLGGRGPQRLPPALLHPLSCLLPELRPPGGMSDVGEATPHLLHEALLALWCDAAVRVVAVDDLQFADAASLDALQALICDVRLGDVAWLLAMRPAESPPGALTLRDALLAERRLSPLVLAPWDVAQVAELVDSLALGLNAATWAPRLHRHTGGNPFFVLETLRQQGQSPSQDGQLPGSATVDALITQGLQRLTPAALMLARVAAIAGDDFSPALAAAVCERSVLELADAWAQLEAAGVLRGRSFAHDLVLAATLRSIINPVASYLHAAVAQQLEIAAAAADGVAGAGIEPARLADHWLAAEQAARALPWLAQAADRARQQLRPQEEADFLSRWIALIEAAQPALAAKLLLRLARVQVEAQGFEAATLPLERALHLAATDADRLQALNLLAEIQLNRLMPEASARSAEQAHGLAQELAMLPDAAEAVLRWHRALCMAGRAAHAETVWQSAQAWMANIPLGSAELASDRGWVLDRQARVHEARAWHQRARLMARATGRPVDEAVVLGNLVQSLLLGGEPAAADQALDQAEALNAQHVGLHAASDYASLYRGMAAAAAGRFAQALQHFEQALLQAAHQSAAVQAAVLAHRAMLWAGIGQRSRAWADAAQVLQHPALPPWVVARAHHAMALAAADPATAAGWQRAVDAFGDPCQLALDAPPRLQLYLLAAAGPPASAALALAYTRALLRQAHRGGHAGLRWAAHWTAAQLAAMPTSAWPGRPVRWPCCWAMGTGGMACGAWGRRWAIPHWPRPPTRQAAPGSMSGFATIWQRSSG
jgi:DNA-binding SARP family transcriptional activator